MKKEYAEEVAAKIIEQLEQGTAPWQKPWKPGELNLPYNAQTGKEYRGINSMWLAIQGHSDPRWITYNQAADAGAQVRKGSKGTKIVYWKFQEERPAKDEQGRPIRDKEGKPKMVTVELERPRTFHAVVFNAEQIDGLPPLPPKQAEPERHARAETVLLNSGANIQHVSGDSAFYRPSTDSITLPERHQFPTADNYYATALHELGHWTGHSSRLDRDLTHPFGSEGYAKEELRAEIASLMLGERMGIGHDPGQHVSYVGSWIKALKEDPKEIFRAAADAEKITNHVMAFEKELTQAAAEPNLDEAKYLVCNDNTLCYRQDGTATLGMLSSNVNGRDWKNGPFIPAASDQLRPASIEDFARFRVMLPSDFQRQPNISEDHKLNQYKEVSMNVKTQQSNEESMIEMNKQLKNELLGSHPEDVVQGIEQSAIARSRYIRGEIKEDDFTKSVYHLMGVKLPTKWSGHTRMVGVADQDDSVVDAAKAGITPQYWQIYAQRNVPFGEESFGYLGSYPTIEDARNMVENLHLINALGTEDIYSRTSMLARIKLDRVRNDPNNTEEISSAKLELDAAMNLQFKAENSLADKTGNKEIVMDKKMQDAIKYIGERLPKPDWETARDLVSSADNKGFVYLPKPNAQYAGKVVMMSDTHLVQQVGKNSAVAHDLAILENGKELERQFDNGEINAGQTFIKVEYGKDKGKAEIVTYNQQRAEYVRAQAEKWAEKNISNLKNRSAFLKHVHAFTQDMAKGRESVKANVPENIKTPEKIQAPQQPERVR